MYGSHPAGEGGEYETITLSMPLYSHRLELVETEVVVTDPEPYPVAYLRVTKARLVPKEDWKKPTASELRQLLQLPEPLDEASQELLDSVTSGVVQTEPVKSEPSAAAAGTLVGPLAAPYPECTLSRRGDWFSLSMRAPQLDVEGIFTHMRGEITSMGSADARSSCTI